MTIDLRAALRRRRPEAWRTRLVPRPRGDLLAADAIVGPGRPVFVPDTNVYILEAAGRLPTSARHLVDRGLLFHCTVCLAELATGVANADPASPTWPIIRDHYSDLFETLPTTRILTPDDATWVEAGLIAGALARIQGFQRQQRKEALNDALIYLTAAKAGLAVLTANRDEFDLIQQLAPHGQFVHF